MSDQFLADRLPQIEAQIVAYEAAIDALSTGVQSYSLDTGQTQQRVTRADIEALQRAVDALYTRRETIRNRLGIDRGTVTARPAW